MFKSCLNLSTSLDPLVFPLSAHNKFLSSRLLDLARTLKLFYLFLSIIIIQLSKNAL